MNKSYLKYAGGKSRILEPLLGLFPSEINNFIEPFAGSCTVSLNVECKGKKIINDINTHLIITHTQCYHNPEKVIEELTGLYESGREKYYDFREEFNSGHLNPIRLAALFIYMNKHGFNGMVRYNSAGLFNVPVGKSKTINFPVDEIMSFKENMGDCGFNSRDFASLFELAGEGDLVYCDPPYTPASATLSDINYTGDGFTHEDHKRLVECAMEATKKGAVVIISNHDTEVTRSLYSEASDIVGIRAFRSISRNGDERGKVNELVAIYN